MKIAAEKAVLYQNLRQDIASGGARTLLLSPPEEWPQVYSVVRGSEASRVRVYLWHLTSDAARGDYKFQLTAVTGNRFVFEDGVRTIVLGYYEPMRLYLAADAERRSKRFGSSPAIQTTKPHLDSARRDGLAAFAKQRTGETAIVMRNDQIATYLLEAEAFHKIGERSSGVRDINAIAAQAQVGPSGPPVLKGRDHRTVTIVRAIRATDFARRVLAAYDYQCCVCGVQLELVEAAHIVPAGAALSSDDTRNGLCLCPLHHDAYDGGLLGVHPDYSVSVSSRATDRLATLSHHGGLQAFRSALMPSIRLPYDRANHPDPGLLGRGLGARNWRG